MPKPKPSAKPSNAAAASDAGLHAIGDVARITGLTPETLRIWERRYGRPVAVRLPSGHRRYTDEHITWLRRVAEALAHGHRPNKVIPLDDAALDALLGEVSEDDTTSEEIERLLGWTLDFRGMEIRAALEARWDPKRPADFLAKRLTPFLRAVGRAWTEGRAEIRHEHFVSEIVMDVLRRLRTAYPAPKAGPAVMLTTLSGERHGLGLQMAALLCAARGIPFHLLGVDTPDEDIVAAAAELPDVKVVGISVALGAGGVETDRQLAGLRAKLPDDIRLIVGGEGARGVRRGPRGVEYVDDIAQWEAALTKLVDAA